MRTTIVLLLLSLALVVPTVPAAGPPLSVEQNTIWNQYTNSPSCCTTFGSTLKDDPLFSGSGNFGTSILQSDADGPFVLDYAITDAEFPYPIVLDEAGTIDVTVHIGGGANPLAPSTGLGRVTAVVELLQGDTSLVAGDGQTINVDPAVQGYQELSWNLAVPQARLDPADGALAWRLTLTGSANGVYVSHVDSSGNGWLTLPITAVEAPVPVPETTYEDLESATFEATFANATTGTFVYNFSTDLAAASAIFTTEGTGSAAGVILDGAGVEVFNATMTAGTVPLGNVTPGDWQMIVDYTAFNGTFSFALSAPVDQASPDEKGADTGNGGSGEEVEKPAEGNATNDGDAGGEGKESPGIALPLFVIGLVALARVRRR